MLCMSTGSDKGPRRTSNSDLEDDQRCSLEDVSFRLRPHSRVKAILAKSQEQVSREKIARE